MAPSVLTRTGDARFQVVPCAGEPFLVHLRISLGKPHKALLFSLLFWRLRGENCLPLEQQPDLATWAVQRPDAVYRPASNEKLEASLREARASGEGFAGYPSKGRGVPLLQKQGAGCACQPGQFRGIQVQSSHATGSQVPGYHRKPAAAMNATSFVVIHPGRSSQAWLPGDCLAATGTGVSLVLSQRRRDFALS